MIFEVATHLYVRVSRIEQVSCVKAPVWRYLQRILRAAAHQLRQDKHQDTRQKRQKLTSASWLRPVCDGFHNLIRFNCAPFFASCRRHCVLTVTCLDSRRCAAYLRCHCGTYFWFRGDLRPCRENMQFYKCRILSIHSSTHPSIHPSIYLWLYSSLLDSLDGRWARSMAATYTQNNTNRE
jgi:hypothetical protein